MTQTKTGSDLFDDVRNFICARLVEQALPSLAVAVGHNGTIIWEEAFGWADRERRIPATPHTVYSLASISKPITATGLMLLKERGVLDLDRPINDYLGEAKVVARVGDAAEATVRRVANHTSGLPLHYHFFYEDEPFRRPLMDETIRRYANLVTSPDERYCYSNLGYGLLDYIISRLSGVSYPAFMRREVFLPLGMTRSSVDIAPGLEPFQALRYGSDGLPYPFYDFDHPGGSAIFSSAHDLVRFGMFHLIEHLPDQKAILSDETITSMQLPTASISEGSGYGIGWGVKEDRFGYRTVSHGGGMGGVSTLLQLVPSERLAVVVLANACTDLAGLVMEEILSVLLPEYAGRRARAEADQKEDDSPEAQNVSFQPPPELMGEWRGIIHTYQGDVPLALWFKASGDVHAQLGAQLKTLVNDPVLKSNHLGGEVAGNLGTEDVNRRPYRLHLDLRLRGEVLNGAVIAKTHFEGDQGGDPAIRTGNGLSHWAEVRKVISSLSCGEKKG
jgi:CubicO group peptidase (beta-lactamase class C family)